MPDLSGKVAIVTGCASGIGAATVRRLRADGAEVLGTDLDASGGAALCAEVGAQFAVQDVSDRALWPVIVARAVETREGFLGHVLRVLGRQAAALDIGHEIAPQAGEDLIKRHGRPAHLDTQTRPSEDAPSSRKGRRAGLCPAGLGRGRRRTTSVAPRFRHEVRLWEWIRTPSAGRS